jgi:predicted DNA repair protein MutK
MAGASLLTLIDDIATILDDVSVMTKVAAKKTAGVLGDDLALNAQQVSGVNADRELPVVWAVAKGSAINKLILVPTALVISAFAPWAVTPLLMLGGLFLCYEGVEKLFHQYFHHEEVNHSAPKKLIGQDESLTVETSEKEKIAGAVRTDFVLSAEIIVITLGTVATAAFSKQVVVLVAIAAIMTIGVYGLVAGIVKLDDGGLYLTKSTGKNGWAEFKRKVGHGILAFAPYMMKTLSVVGTAAMFLVGGAILTHGIPAVHHWIENFATSLNNGFLHAVVPALLNGLFGIIAGAAALLIISIVKQLLDKLNIIKKKAA